MKDHCAMKQLIVLLALSTLGLCHGSIEGVATGMRLLRVFPNWADFQPIHAVPLNGGNWNKVNEIRMFPSEEKLPDTAAGILLMLER